MRLNLVVTCVAILCVISIQVGFAAPASATCDLPWGLPEEISKRYPDAHVVTKADPSEQGRQLFQKDHANGCPGLAKVNFYGDGKPTWALVLITGENPKRKAELLVAHQLGEVWEILSLETTNGTPVVWREGPGKYDDLDGQKTIRATRPVVVFAGYGSWAVIYAWDGEAVQKVQISD